MPMSNDEYVQFIDTMLKSVLTQIEELDIDDFDKASVASNLSIMLTINSFQMSMKPSEALIETLRSMAYQSQEALMRDALRLYSLEIGTTKFFNDRHAARVAAGNKPLHD